MDPYPGWPAGDPWPPATEPMHPLVAAARTVAKEILEPYAARADRRSNNDTCGVPRSHLTALAQAGLMGAPLAAAPVAVTREVQETLGLMWLDVAGRGSARHPARGCGTDPQRGGSREMAAGTG